MGTTTSVTVYGKNERDIAEIEDLIDKLDREKLSWRQEGSLTAKLNNGEKVDDEVYLNWIRKSVDISKSTDGAYDITLRPLIELWGIETASPKVPEDEELKSVLENIGYEALLLDSEFFCVTDRKLDLGACGKGIALNCIRDYLNDHSVKASCVAVGGSVLTYGDRPDNKAWTVGINDPKEPNKRLYGTLKLKGTHCISTSGNYEKYFEKDGKRYHHIFDPTTGYPAESGLSSVTVICDDGLVSDALSTACFVLGYEKSIPILKEYDAHGVFITDDYEMKTTPDFPYEIVNNEKS
ncbi:MAG: FAD:protein FMN transferase [Lachnospiraceae bacterium]|nr:FAD:protein FMN transferase [Lachnospiraceae bacterium]